MSPINIDCLYLCDLSIFVCLWKVLVYLSVHWKLPSLPGSQAPQWAALGWWCCHGHSLQHLGGGRDSGHTAFWGGLASTSHKTTVPEQDRHKAASTVMQDWHKTNRHLDTGSHKTAIVMIQGRQDKQDSHYFENHIAQQVL